MPLVKSSSYKSAQLKSFNMDGDNSALASSPPKTAELKGQSGVVPDVKEGIQSDTSAVPVAAAENVLAETKIQPGSMV
uniref:Uncharacterized protein n=1 Tax=Ditylenchus dipsaci TaxID=166011 RepID=A0A915D742_9BILA